MSGLIKVVRKAKPFYSRVDEAAEALPRPKGTGKEFMTELSKQPGVKKAEIEDRKLKELESLPKMTKQEFVKKLEEKPASTPETKVLSDTDAPDEAKVRDRAEQMMENEARIMARNQARDSEEARDIFEDLIEDWRVNQMDEYMERAAEDLADAGTGQTKYGKYTVPGGENYREILLKLPGQGASKMDDLSRRIKQYEDMANAIRSQYPIISERPAEAQSKLYMLRDLQGELEIQQQELRRKTSEGVYQSRHWDDPNVLAHIRVVDRKGPNGEKILHVEEIQSDWHQAGRKKGYGNTINDQGHYNIGVPDAPFKKNWHELAMKKVMDYAAEGGYDKVAITPGREQADRYKLSRYINSIDATPTPDGEGFMMKIVDKNGKVVANHRYENDELPEQVGKEMADKIMSSGGGRFEGLDLQVGGEGMTGFYDQILPTYINKEYGKYGVKVGPGQIATEPTVTRGEDNLAIFTPNYFDVHSVDITPELRESIKTKGQPLYQAIGAGTAGAAAMPEEPKEKVHISDNPDAMMLEMENKGFAGGGLLKKAAKAIKGTQEVLPAAEREENLRKMLDRSKVKNRVYHGTESKDDYIEETKGNDAIKSFAGQATWVAEEPYTSNAYSGKSGYMMPLHVRLNKPLTINHVDANDEANNIYGVAKGLGVDVDHLRYMASPESVWEVINHPYFIEAASKAGFDGISIKEGGRQTHSVFNPGNIKSAIGNRGTYDMTDPDINKAVGGLTKAKRK